MLSNVNSVCVLFSSALASNLYAVSVGFFSSVVLFEFPLRFT